jgi:3-oxoacyl-[acyl-carrier protein] reductase
MDLHRRVAVVTGGSGGLGSVICRVLAQAGASVAVGYNTRKDKAQALAAELTAGDVSALAVHLDVTAQKSIEDAVTETMSAFGRIDVLVNDAAYNRYIPFRDLQTLDEAVWQQIMQCNLTGPFLTMRAVAPIMKRQGAGRIVNITSIAGFAPRGSSMAYAVSKSALNHLTRCMAVSLAPEVLVNAVAPGMMLGTLMSNNLPPNAEENYHRESLLHKPPTLEDVAAVVLTFVNTDSITGQTLVVDSGVILH